MMFLFSIVDINKALFKKGELVYELPTLEQIRSYHRKQLELFWPEYLRKLNPES
jgi:nicotinate phosphoribosyltransferase